MAALQGTIAVVTGASRGAGRGIAIELGAAGATVYVTGRSRQASAAADGMVGTVAETAALVTQAGGLGIAVGCDHTQDEEVAALFAQVQQEQGRLDLLVNNVWGGYERYDESFDAPFWEQQGALQSWHGMFTAGVLAHYLASRHAVPLMLPQRRGLIVNTSAGDTTAGVHRKYLGNLVYHVAKASIDHLAQGMAHELRPHGITALGVYPGFMATERVLATLAAAPPEVAQAHGPQETPHYVGRAVVALAADPLVFQKTGALIMVGHLAREYGFTDIDGSQPPPFVLPETSLMA